MKTLEEMQALNNMSNTEILDVLNGIENGILDKTIIFDYETFGEFSDEDYELYRKKCALKKVAEILKGED